MDRPRRNDGTAGQIDGEAGWWTTSGNIGLPPLARVMGVGRQQQHVKGCQNLRYQMFWKDQYTYFYEYIFHQLFFLYNQPISLLPTQ